MEKRKHKPVEAGTCTFINGVSIVFHVQILLAVFTAVKLKLINSLLKSHTHSDSDSDIRTLCSLSFYHCHSTSLTHWQQSVL